MSASGPSGPLVFPFQLPDPSMVTNYYEPMVNGTIIAPDDYFGDIVSLCQVGFSHPSRIITHVVSTC